jgi:hypothetical protein
MSQEFLAIQYRIEIYENSFTNDPSAVWHSSTPFLTMSVGDYIDHRAWVDASPNMDLGENEILRVKAISHLLWTIKGSHVGHSLSVCVERAMRP